MLSQDSETWFLIWAAVHLASWCRSGGFRRLVVEVLHRLVVDQAVDGAGVGGRVEFVGLARRAVRQLVTLKVKVT
jgi:hypothetical protein